jgi:hypothetical protein
MLFKKLAKPDRQQTQLAYKVKYFPYNELPQSGKDLVVWKRNIYMRKQELEDRLDETKTLLNYQGKDYVILWAYNNIPTVMEWEGKSATFIIRIELRASPAIPEYAVAILNFELASSKPINAINLPKD